MRSVAVAALVVLAVRPLRAQIPFNNCYDRADRLVPGEVHNDLGIYGGMAMLKGGHPVIYWNQQSMEHSSKAFQVYLYMHECAHVRLRHIYKHEETPDIEQQADCWALQLLFDGGMLDGPSAGVLESEIRTMPGDAMHDRGEVILRRASACRAARTDADQWRPILDSLARLAPDSFKAIRGTRISEVTNRIDFEANLGTPGVFDCDLDGGTVYRCLLFATLSQGSARRAYGATVKILKKWFPSGWSDLERKDPNPGIEKELDAQDGRTGTTFTLALTNGGRLWFIAAPGGP